ncbi:MAG: hypothetical protein QXK89_08585 [Candidatus Bathyarchaeia archaeon]
MTAVDNPNLFFAQKRPELPSGHVKPLLNLLEPKIGICVSTIIRVASFENAYAHKLKDYGPLITLSNIITSIIRPKNQRMGR